MKLTLRQKRFLIVWVCINTFAIFVNLAKVDGIIVKKERFWCEWSYPDIFYYDHMDEGEKQYLKNYYQFSSNSAYRQAIDSIYREVRHRIEKEGETEIHLFTNSSIENKGGVFPFHGPFFLTEFELEHMSYSGSSDYVRYAYKYFNGIFNGYTYIDFAVYLILGFAIIYLPKMWKG